MTPQEGRCQELNTLKWECLQVCPCVCVCVCVCLHMSPVCALLKDFSPLVHDCVPAKYFDTDSVNKCVNICVYFISSSVKPLE